MGRPLVAGDDGPVRPLGLVALPSGLLLPAAVAVRRRALRTLVPALLIALGPVMGFALPLGRLDADPPASAVRLRLLTCNMHYAKVDPSALDRLVAEESPDVVVLQEWRDSNGSAILQNREYRVHREPGQFLASRFPITKAERLGSDTTGVASSTALYELITPQGAIAILSVHMASPRKGLAELAGRGRGGLDEIASNSELRWTQSRWLAERASQIRGPLVVAGDFNTPPQSAIFRRIWDGYTDAFGSAGLGWGYTFNTRPTSVRIDHILLRDGGKASRCWVGPDVGSPHRPVLADVHWATDQSDPTKKPRPRAGAFAEPWLGQDQMSPPSLILVNKTLTMPSCCARVVVLVTFPRMTPLSDLASRFLRSSSSVVFVLLGKS